MNEQHHMLASTNLDGSTNLSTSGSQTFNDPSASISLSLSDPSFPTNIVYLQQQQQLQQQKQQQQQQQQQHVVNVAERPQWDHDQFLEQPQGHVAQPRYHKQQTPSTPNNNNEGYGYEDFEENVESNSRNSFLYGLVGSHHNTSLGVSPALLGVLAYFFGWLGGLAVMGLERKNIFVIFHGWQSLVLGLSAFLVQFLFVWSSAIYTFLWICYLLLNGVMMYRVLKDAPQQRLFKLPGIGDWCEVRAFSKAQYHTSSNYSYYHP